MRLMANDRDSSIERLLRARRVNAAAQGESCLDAETLAAWTEGGLPHAAREAAERHAADCAHCQALLAAMARTASTDEARAPRGPWRAQWLVPIGAVAAAVLVWVAVDRVIDGGPRSRPTPARAPPVAGASPNRPAGQESRAASAPADELLNLRAESAPPATSGSKAAASRQTRLSKSESLEDRKRADAIEPRAGLGGSIDAIRPLTGRSQSGAPIAAVPPPPVAATPPPPASLLPPPVSPEAKASKPLTGTVTVQSESPRARVAGGIDAAAATPVAAGVEVVSPDPKFRWRVRGATIERSIDAGVNWTVQSVAATPLSFATPNSAGAPATWTAGSSPSPDVCWIVGRRGMALLSIDGRTWQMRRLPLTVDLTAVDAIDAKTAVVTTADGRQFSTSDAGTSWAQVRGRPPAE